MLTKIMFLVWILCILYMILDDEIYAIINEHRVKHGKSTYQPKHKKC